jgi:hypothetical protein
LDTDRLRWRACAPRSIGSEEEVMLRLAVFAAVVAVPSLVSAASFPVLSGNVQVLDTQTLDIAGTKVRLAYVDGGPGPLAARMQAAIVARGGVATCYPFDDGRYACALPDGEDVATLAVMYGFARSAADAPQTMKDAQREAATEGFGGWRSGSDVSVWPPGVVQVAPLPRVVTPGDVVTQDYAAPLPPPDDLYATAAAAAAEPLTADYDGLTYPLVWGGASLGWGFYDNAHYWHAHVPPAVPHAGLPGPRIVSPGTPLRPGSGPLPIVVHPVFRPASPTYPLGIPSLAPGQYHPLPHAYATSPFGGAHGFVAARPIVVAHVPFRAAHVGGAVVR